MHEPGIGLFITTSSMAQLALQAIAVLDLEGIHCGLLHLHTIKPLDGTALAHWLPQVSAAVTVEEHTRIGGLGSAVLEHCNDHMPEQTVKITRIGLSDKFAEQYGTQETLLAHWGLTVDKLCDAMRSKISKK
jgi:transketolase